MTDKLPVSEWRVLWFSPNAGLWQISQLEHELANGMAEGAAQVAVIRCKGIFDDCCPTMQANGLTLASSTVEKKSICKSCRRQEATMRSVAEYETVWIDDYLTEEMRQTVNLEMAVLEPSNWADVQREGIKVGVYATYLTLLIHKVPDITATTESWNEYGSDLKDSLYVAGTLPRIFETVQPTHCFVYDPLYPTNRIFTEMAIRNVEIQYVGVSVGGYIPDRYSTLALYRSIEASQTAVDSGTLLESMNVPLSELEIKLVARHMYQLVQGVNAWVYSTPPSSQSIGEIRQSLGLKNDLPVSVVLVGSPDETRASKQVGAEFGRVPLDELTTVQEFIEQTLEVARDCPDINFVIRLHPRLAPNQREKLRSPDLDAIEKLLAHRPDNVFVNSPNDGIGLYDVARIASFGINHASSAGLEFLAIGIPVIHFDPPRLNAYPPGFGFQVNRSDQQGFLRAIAQAQQTPISAANAVTAWRWYAVTLLRAITHKSWTTNPQLPNQSVSPKFQGPRNLVPATVRERISRNQSQRKRQREFHLRENSRVQSDWIDECIMRISNFDNSTIWNPTAITRGTPLAASREAHLVTAEVEKIRAQISGTEN